MAKARKLTYAKAAELMKTRWMDDCSVSTVRDTVQGQGNETREKQMRVMLEEFLGIAVPANTTIAASAISGIELREQPDEYRTVEEWKQIAMTYRNEAELLRDTLHRLTAPRPVSSTPPLSEAQSIAKQSGDEHDRRQKK